MVFTASFRCAMDCLATPTSLSSSAQRLCAIVRQGCFGTGYPVFPPFYGFLSTDQSDSVKWSGKPNADPSHRRSTLTRRRASKITRDDARCIASRNGVSDETDGTFTVFAKLTVCVVGWS